MKRIQYYRYGGPEQMKLDTFELVAPSQGEVAVKVKFAAINPIDWKLRKGDMKIVTGKTFPRAMGMDFSGVVVAVGVGVTRFQVGDAVFGLARFKESGALGQSVVTKESFLAIKPEGVSFETAACLGTPGVTAWNGLIDKAKLRSGQYVFINGCAGAVGEAAVQIAKQVGAIVSGCCSARDMEKARSLGVETVYDYNSTKLSSISTRFDVIFDTAATMPQSIGMGMLRRGGIFLDLNPDLGKFIRAIFNSRLKIVLCTPRGEILDKIANSTQEGKYRVSIGETVSLDNAISLITELESGRKLGGKGVVAME